MGYRNYLYRIKKKDVNKFRNMPLKELQDKYSDKEDDSYIDIHKLIGEDCIFEFGKLYWDDTIERIENSGEELFKQEEVQEWFCNYRPHLVGKEALKVTIDIYENKIKKMYENLQEEIEKAKTFEEKCGIYQMHFRDYEYWWKNCKVINLEKDAICHSWLYEHLIFELVHLYKTIDFNEYDLIFMGW